MGRCNRGGEHDLRQHWREGSYWGWVWRERTPGAVKLVLGGVLLAAVLVGGWFAADRLTSAEAKTASDSVVLETTVKQVITVREKGKQVTRTVPVVKRVVRIRARTQTQTETRVNRETALRYATQVVTAPGKTRLVRRVVTTKIKVPVVTTKVVRQNGKTRTVAVTSFVPTTRVETQVQTQTQRVTQTQPGSTVVQTSTQNHTTTQTTTQVQTTTQTQTQTQTQTETTTVVQPTTITNTQTVTDTVTSTVTQTVTAPAVTVCVPGPC
jgi:hypothetical protein